MACDMKGGVAKNGTLPWPKNKEDLQNFKEYTTGKIVVMGSTTWKDPCMPSPLPNRYNVVLSSDPNKVLKYGRPDLIISGTPSEIMSKIPSDRDIVVIGGANVFIDFIAHECINEIILTVFNQDYEADTFINLTDLMYKFSVLECKVYDQFKIFKMIKN